MFGLTFDHIDTTISALDQTQKDFEQNVDQLLQKAGQTSNQEAISHAAVRTGNMRDSITNESGYLSSETYTDVYYSYFVELGTVKQQAQPFMIPALEVAKAQLLQDLQAL